MSNARLRLAFAGETMFPHAFSRSEFALANFGLAKIQRAPFFLRAGGTSRFPTPLPAHGPVGAP
jgi:hypothetical protein